MNKIQADAKIQTCVFYLLIYIMPKVSCAVIGCTNSTKQLNKWTWGICDAHHHLGSCITKGNCKDCEKPLALYCFPSVLNIGEERKLG